MSVVDLIDPFDTDEPPFGAVSDEDSEEELAILVEQASLNPDLLPYGQSPEVFISEAMGQFLGEQVAKHLKGTKTPHDQSSHGRRYSKGTARYTTSDQTEITPELEHALDTWKTGYADPARWGALKESLRERAENPGQESLGETDLEATHGLVPVDREAELILDVVARAPEVGEVLYRGIGSIDSATDSDARVFNELMPRITKEGSTFTLPPSSFTADYDLAYDTAHSAAGFGNYGEGHAILIQVQGGGRAFPVDQVMPSAPFSHQEEYIAGGKYKVSSVRREEGFENLTVDIVTVTQVENIPIEYALPTHTKGEQLGFELGKATWDWDWDLWELMGGPLPRPRSVAKHLKGTKAPHNQGSHGRRYAGSKLAERSESAKWAALYWKDNDPEKLMGRLGPDLEPPPITKGSSIQNDRIAEAAALMDEIAESSPKNYSLYRGTAAPASKVARIEELARTGVEFDMEPKGFTPERRLAQEFVGIYAAGTPRTGMPEAQMGIIWEIKPGKTESLGVDNKYGRSKFAVENEHIAGGRFRITSARRVKRQGEEQLHVVMEQTRGLPETNRYGRVQEAIQALERG